MITLSIIITGIRPNNWINIYNNIKSSLNESFEIIFVGPYEPPEELKQHTNIHYYKDMGSPNRCQQIGCTLASGKYITWLADDITIIYNQELQNIVNLLELHQNNYKTVVVAKYTEGEQNNPGMLQDQYYYIGNSYPKTPYILYHWWIFNIAILHRKYFEKLGGFDCKFETTCIPHADLAVRAQRDDANVIMLPNVLLHINHVPNITGDHGPIHYAQQQDEVLFKQTHSSAECLYKIHIPIDNWKQSPDIWKRRFND